MANVLRKMVHRGRVHERDRRNFHCARRIFPRKFSKHRILGPDLVRDEHAHAAFKQKFWAHHLDVEERAIGPHELEPGL